MSLIDFQPAATGELPHSAEIASLRANRIAPRFLYVTPRQSELWREVFLRHSPIHRNPEFARIYRDAFAGTAQRVAGRAVHLVGLGCGTGLKETALFKQLNVHGCSVTFSAVDVSAELVRESTSALGKAGATLAPSLVGDLVGDYLQGWLSRLGSDTPRLFTFFGLCPNFPPATVAAIFRSVLRPGDLLLVSAHLAPIQGDAPQDLAEAMAKILSQYDNDETKAWLAEGIRHWGLSDRLSAPQIKVNSLEGIPAILGTATWLRDETFTQWGTGFEVNQGDPVRLFYSLRYTPLLFEARLLEENFELRLLSKTDCGEEGIWSVELNSPQNAR